METHREHIDKVFEAARYVDTGYSQGMYVQRVKYILQHIAFPYFPIKFGFGFSYIWFSSTHLGFTVPITMQTYSRDNGSPMRVYGGIVFPEQVLSEKEILDHTRKYLMKVVLHEFHEMFQYKGEIIYDPHDPLTRPIDIEF